MKYILIILLFPLCVSAQKKTDSIAMMLHEATDSFMANRCRALCAMNAGKKDSVVFYERRRRYFYELAFRLYELYDPKRYDAKLQKTKMRFMNPNKYYKCACH